MDILNWLRRRRRLNARAAVAPFVDFAEDSIYEDSLIVDLTSPIKGKKYVSTGSHCVLGGRYIFETQDGAIQIGDRVHIGASTFICRNHITIGDDVTIAWDCLIYDHNSHSTNWAERQYDTEREYQDRVAGRSTIASKDWSVVKSAPITIGNKVWIGAGCTILKGVTIGEGAIVGAGSVVTRDVEPWTIVGGNPAQVVRRIDPVQ